jgi:CRP-like cAMP-binding protein
MIIETLKKSEIFSSLKDGELQKILDLFEQVSFKNNETIFGEGDPSDKLYLVAEGSVKILKHTMMGKDISSAGLPSLIRKTFLRLHWQWSLPR